MKDILTECIPKKYLVTDDMSIASSGLAKLFVGELIETALDVLRERVALEGQWLEETSSGTAANETVKSSSSSSRYCQNIQSIAIMVDRQPYANRTTSSPLAH